MWRETEKEANSLKRDGDQDISRGMFKKPADFAELTIQGEIMWR